MCPMDELRKNIGSLLARTQLDHMAAKCLVGRHLLRGPSELALSTCYVGRSACNRCTRFAN